MPIDTSIPGSQGWWLQRLMGKLVATRDDYDALWSYYTGDAAVPPLAAKAVRDSYKRLMRMARTNFAELIVEAVRERMEPRGFRTGAAGDDLGDAEAWRIWQANQLDADSLQVHRAMLTMRDAYVMVGPVVPEIDAPLITPEDPREVYAEMDPVRKRKAIAAIKVFRDGEFDRAYLYLPGFVYRAQRRAVENDVAGVTSVDVAGWDWLDAGQQLPAPVVPVVKFTNRADLRGQGKGEFETHIPILDRINFTVLSRLEIATMQAFRQRGIKGLPADDSSGEPIDYDDLFAADPGALWQLPETAEIWESGQVDLGPIRSAVRDDVQDLAAVTRTPLFYLTPEAANGSAEGASLAREGLVFKTADHLVETSEPWEQVMSLAFTFAGDEQRASRTDMEVIWASPERFSLAERYDAAAKAQAAGVPWRTVMQDVLGFSPQKIERMAIERAAEQLAQVALTPLRAADANA